MSDVDDIGPRSDSGSDVHNVRDEEIERDSRFSAPRQSGLGISQFPLSLRHLSLSWKCGQSFDVFAEVASLRSTTYVP